MNEFFSIKDKVALITGATGYLGKSMAKGLAKSGALVYLNGRNEKKVNELILELEKQGLQVKAAVFDVTNKNEIKSFFSNFDHKNLDIIVNNAYSNSSGSVETAKSEDYALSYEVTQISAHNIVQCALPYLRNAFKINGDASVINIASMYGMVSPDLSIYDSKEVSSPPFYGAAKAALIQWSKYAACEFAKEGIRFNSISPGPFPSTETQKSNSHLITKIINKVPMHRIGQPNELIGPVLFLASPSSSFVTGVNLAVDGGWTAW